MNKTTLSSGVKAVCANGKAWGKKAAILCAAAALCLMVLPASAFGAGAHGDTDVYLLVDDAQLSVTAPESISCYLCADGTFITPDPDAFCITNESIIPACVKCYSVNGYDPFMGMTKANYNTEDADDFENVYYLTAQIGNEGEVLPINSGIDTLGTEWNMTAKGTDGATLELTTEGAMKNITTTLSPSNQLASIMWTFSATLNQAK